MPTLKVSNGFTRALPGFGRITPFRELSEKRVTKATRQCLRSEFGFSAVEVSCGADLREGLWQGKCRIHGEQFTYRVHP